MFSLATVVRPGMPGSVPGWIGKEILFAQADSFAGANERSKSIGLVRSE
jgi:hypothetical protein